MNRKLLLAITIIALVAVAVISTAILTLHPNSPLKAETTYTVSVGSNHDIGFIATFWKDGNLETYCIVPPWKWRSVNLKEGFYNTKIYYEMSGKFKEEFEIFVCKNLTITIYR